MSIRRNVHFSKETNNISEEPNKKIFLAKEPKKYPKGGS